MIQVKIHKNHRDTKPIVFQGMNIRELIGYGSTFIILILSQFVEFKSSEMQQWSVIFAACFTIPIALFKFRGMYYETAILTFLEFKFRTKAERLYLSENTYDLINNAIKQAEIDALKEKFKNVEKMKYEASLEKLVLYYDAIENSSEPVLLDSFDKELLTVSRFKIKKKVKKTKVKDDDELNSIEKLNEKVESIYDKQRSNPAYTFSKKELGIIQKYHRSIENKKVVERNKKKSSVQIILDELKKRKKLKSKLPISTQNTIPFIADYEDGLFEVRKGQFSKSYIIRDINYTDAKDEEQIEMFLAYGQFLNYFTSDFKIKLTLDNRIISKELLEKQVLYQHQGDNYDVIRDEYNSVLRKRLLEGKNDKQLTKFFTISIEAENPLEANIRFQSIESDIRKNLRRIGSSATLCSTEERLSYLHDKFRKGREGNFNIDFDFLKAQGLSSKDYIAPSSFYFPKSLKNEDYFKIEKDFYKCFAIVNLPSSLGDSLLTELTSVNFEVMVTIDSQPIKQSKAIKDVKLSLAVANGSIMEAQRKATKAGYDPNLINPDLQEGKEEAAELLESMKNQKMFSTSIFVMVNGSSLKELENNCSQINSLVEQHSAQLVSMTMQQEEAFKTVLPIGYTSSKIKIARGLSTENLSIFMPFDSEELFQVGGIYYGLHQVKRTFVMCARRLMKSPSGFIVGKSGSGKSFAAKNEMINHLLREPDANIDVVDPDDEYGDFGKIFNAEILDISSTSDIHINALDMNENYGLDEKDNPKTISMKNRKSKALTKKTEYLISLLDVMLNGDLSIEEKGVIDKATKKVYAKFLESDFNQDFIPVLPDLHNVFVEFGETDEVAKKLASKTYYNLCGSTAIFSKKTNVTTNANFRIYVTKHLNKDQADVASLVILDAIWIRTISNLMVKKRTYAYIDEIHRFFKSRLASEYLEQYYKRGRKYGLITTGITQNAIELTKNEIAVNMLSNSDFILMYDQSHTDLLVLSELLNLSASQRGYLTRTTEGAGLLFAEKVILPIEDNFPQSSYLYTLINTKFDEEKNIEEIQAFVQQLIEESKKNRHSESSDAA